MLLTYTAAISAANTPRWADNGTKTAPIEVTDTMAYETASSGRKNWTQ